jgi:hypothetical protein
MSKTENSIQHPSSGVLIPYSLVRDAMEDQGLTHYPMSLVGSAVERVRECVNQGIDSYLEACNSPDRGDGYAYGERSIGSGKNKRVIARTLECQVSAQSLPVLLRRLSEVDYDENDEDQTLAADVLHTLGIDDAGKYQRPED